MQRRGVRELKVNASAVLALVKAGETVEITERGLPVARLVPMPTEPDTRSQYRKDLDSGLIIRERGRLEEFVPLDIPTPVDAPNKTLSDYLFELRSSER